VQSDRDSLAQRIEGAEARELEALTGYGTAALPLSLLLSISLSRSLSFAHAHACLHACAVNSRRLLSSPHRSFRFPRCTSSSLQVSTGPTRRRRRRRPRGRRGGESSRPHKTDLPSSTSSLMRASVVSFIYLTDSFSVFTRWCVCGGDLTCQEACVDLEAQLAQARELALSLAQEYEGGLIGLESQIGLVPSPPVRDSRPDACPVSPCCLPHPPTHPPTSNMYVQSTRTAPRRTRPPSPARRRTQPPPWRPCARRRPAASTSCVPPTPRSAGRSARCWRSSARTRRGQVRR